MSKVVLQPNSSTNQTEDFQVVDSEDWFSFINGGRADVPATSYATFKEAEAAALAANEEELRSSIESARDQEKRQQP